MSITDFKGDYGTDVRPAREGAGRKLWAKNPSGVGAADGTRLDATTVNDLVASLRRVVELAGLTPNPGDDDALADAVAAIVAAAVTASVQAVQALVFKGAWDASAGTFPGGGAAKTGWFYKVSVGGTVGGVLFSAGDDVFAVVDDASPSVYANNWLKIEGALTLAELEAVAGGPLGTVTNVATGFGLSGGPIASTGTIALNPGAALPLAALLSGGL